MPKKKVTVRKRVGKKKVVRRRSSAKKMATKKASAKKVTRRIPLSKKTAVKRNPTRTRYWLQVGSKYFDGGGLTANPLNAVYFDSKKQAAKIAVKLANASGRSVSVHSNRKVKKK